MALRRHTLCPNIILVNIQSIPGLLPVHDASLNIPTASASLAPPPAKHYTSVTIVKNPSIISSAIDFAKTIHTLVLKYIPGDSSV